MPQQQENILWTYYQGVAERLRAEVDLLNKVIGHDDSVGEANEVLVRNLVRKFIPARYGVGSGIIVDHNGKASRQCDIVIYDPVLYPSLFALGEVHLFPVDLVYGVVEVKTTVDSGKAKQAIANIESVRRLEVVPGAFAAWHQNGFASFEPSPPLGFVFGFNSRSGTDPKTGKVLAPKFETFLDWWVPRDRADRVWRPFLVGCLDQGIAKYSAFPVEPTTSFKGLACVLCEDDGTARAFPPGIDTVTVGRLVYPVRDVPVPGSDVKRFAIDHGKVLLYFLLMMNKVLAMRRIKPDIDIAEHYLKGSLRMTVEVDR